MPRYRRDVAYPQSDGARVWYSRWMAGETIAGVENCRLMGLVGDNRANVHALNEPDTYFSIPAECSFKGARVRGYLTMDEGNVVFRHCYY